MRTGFRGRGARLAIAAGLLTVCAIAFPAASAASHLQHRPAGVQPVATQANFTLPAVLNDETLGSSVAEAGDVNDDGIADIAIGAPAIGAFPALPGRVYVVFGRAGGGTIDLANLGSGGFIITSSTSNDQVGSDVESVGDMNGDGHDDLIVGAAGADEAYVVFGKAGSAQVDTDSLGSQGFTISGGAIGNPVAGIGDFNDDGTPDVAVADPTADLPLRTDAGQVWVIYGKSTTGDVSLGSVALPAGTQGFRLDGVEGTDRLGSALDAAGDVNGDGVADLVAGAPIADVDGAFPSAGVAYALFGDSPRPPAGFQDVDEHPGFQMYRQSSGSINTGRSVSGHGDVNDDGRDELLIGTAAETAYVVFGKEDEDAVDLDPGDVGSAAYSMTAPSNGAAGYHVDGARDVNGDGTPDTLFSNQNRNNLTGSAYTVFGQAGAGTIAIEGPPEVGSGNPAGFRMDGGQAQDQFSRALSDAGDFNGDGAPDVLTSSRAGDGTAYITFGWENAPPEAAITSAPPDPTNSPDATFQYTVTDANEALNNTVTVECSLDGEDFGPCPGTPGEATYTGLAEGEHTFAVRGTDSFHNTGAPATHEWEVDLTPPAAAITNPAEDGTATSDTTPTFEFTAETGAALECSVDQGTPSWGPCDSTTAHTPGSPLPEGAWTFRLRATDAAGNATTVARTLEVDTSVPDVAITDPAADGTVTSDTQPGIVFAAEAGATVECSVDQGTPAYGPCETDTTHAPAAPLANGAWTYRVRATDPGGTAVATRTIIVDTTPPTAEITGPASDGALTNDRTPELTFEAEAGATVRCSIHQGTPDFGPCDGPGSHSPANPLADGAYTFEIEVTDAAGNVTTRTRTFEVDGTPPAAEITSPATDGTETEDRTPTFSFTFEPGATVECSVDQGTPAYGPCNGPEGSHTPASDLAPGAHNFRIRVTDAAGNVTERTRTIVISAPDPEPVLRCRGLEATITGSAGPDTIVGTTGPDVIAAGPGSDRIFGLGGDDVICAQAGLDTVFGGPGDDFVLGNRGGDRLVGNRGDDDLRGNRGPDRLLGRLGNDRLIGNENRDDLRGNQGNDTLLGGRHGDLLIGNQGRDRLFGAHGQDRLFGARGPDRLWGGPQRDLLNGGAGPDGCNGGGGPDRLRRCP